MVVAADAAERQAEHRAADRHQHVVELVVANPLDGLRGDLAGIRTRDQKPGCSGTLIIVRLQFVARQLHAHELVVRHVVVQRANDPVAIVIRAGAEAVELVAATLGEPGDIEPMPGPAFAVTLAA